MSWLNKEILERKDAPTATSESAAPAATVGDNASTGLAISNTPGGDGAVDILVNGIQYELGNGVKTKDAYFSADAGLTARAIGSIVAGDTLFWNVGPTRANFSLAITDKVSMNYNR